MNFKSNPEMKHLALLMTLHCVRNTVIEDYHSSGKITDDEIKKFNIEVSNKIYSFLELLTNKDLTEYWSTIINNPKVFYMPTNWNQPRFDKEFKKALESLLNT